MTSLHSVDDFFAEADGLSSETRNATYPRTVSRREKRAFLGLGSNLGDRWGYLRDCVAALPDVVAVSPVYETEPVGGPEGQGPFLNCVVELSTVLSARQLLGVARDAEAAARRVRLERWGPRTLDVDVLWIEDETVHSEDLVVPHPRAAEREFVLVPLADLAPELAESLRRPGSACPAAPGAGGLRRVGTI